MDILITGESGVGKSILANKIKNYIFKVDKNSIISLRDATEPNKTTGSGTNEYVIAVNREPSEEDLKEADIIINVKNQVLVSRIKEL